MAKKSRKLALFIGALVLVAITATALPFGSFGLNGQVKAAYDIKANLGQVMVDGDATIAVFVSPNGAQTGVTIPNHRTPRVSSNDYTYIVQECQVVDGEIWVGLFIGAARSGWIPYTAVLGPNPRYPFNPAVCQ